MRLNRHNWMNPKWWQTDGVKNQGLALAGEADDNIMGRKMHKPWQFVPALNASSTPASPQRWHYGSEPCALRAVLINYLPVATNTAPVTLHRCPRMLIQEIRADTPFKAVLFS